MSFWAIGVAGAVLALPYVAIARRRPPAGERRVFAWGLVVAAAVYVAFAARGAPLSWTGLELVGVLGFGALAAAGAWRWRGLLAAGWALHVGWDVVFHGASTPFVPGWYPALCVGFDLVVAGAIALRLRAGSQSDAARRR